MAKAKLYDWGDGNGKIHTKSKADHDKTAADKKAAAGRVTDPPSGYYDPNLDVQERTEQKSYDRRTDDNGRVGERAGVDLGLQTKRTGIEKGRVGEDYDTGKAAIERGAGRSLTDLLQARTRGGEDYQSSLGDLQRNYDRLGNSQGEAARKSGAEPTGGVFAQSARKRAENQSIDKAPIDLAYQRFTQDSNTSEGRLNEDKGLSLAELIRSRDRNDEDLDWSQAGNALTYDRTTRDLNTDQERTDTDHSDFGQDIRAAKQFQWGGQAVTGAGTPATTIKAPTPAVAPSPTSSPAPTSITAGPRVPGTKKTTRKSGKNHVVTYSNSVGGP